MWKVARYTTAAAPLYFSEVDNYIDGGFLANNPSQAAWTEINKHLQEGEELHPSLIVSVGTGIPPNEPLKEMTISLTRVPQMLELVGILVSYSVTTQCTWYKFL